MTELANQTGNQQSRKSLTNGFEQVFVDYLSDETSKCERLTIVSVSELSGVHILKGHKHSLSPGFVSSASQREFALGLSNSATSICHLTVHPTSVESVLLPSISQKKVAEKNNEMF